MRRRKQINATFSLLWHLHLCIRLHRPRAGTWSASPPALPDANLKRQLCENVAFICLRRLRKKTLFFGMILHSFFLCANPKEGQIVKGDVTMRSKGKTLSIHAGEKSIIQWKEFSIDAGEKIRFIQPSAHSAVLNRVSNKISHINGLLEANGHVYLLNPNGVVIGKEGHIQSRTFIASTLHLNDEVFLNHQDLFFKGNSEAKIVNLGKIEALGGDVFLFAKTVINEGKVQAFQGSFENSTENEILLKPNQEQRLFISTKKAGGMIQAKQCLNSDGNVYSLAINKKGIIEAIFEKSENEKEVLSKEPSIAFSPSSSSGRAVAEMFQNLKTYDDFLFTYKNFLFGYDKGCYHPHLYPKGMISSFDLYHQEMLEMVRPKYRNYHLKYVESF